MKLFKLLAGQHIQADQDYKFTEEEVQLAKETGVKLKLPAKKYSQGDVVPSEIDLVERFGADKFSYMGEKSRERSASDEKRSRVKEATPQEDDLDTSTHRTDEPPRSTHPVPAADVKPKEPNLEQMNDKQLNEFAHAHEVDISKAKTRQEKISLIKGRK